MADGSVLTAVGELLMFSLIMKLPEAIKSGRNIHIRKGTFEAEVSGKDNKEN